MAAARQKEMNESMAVVRTTTSVTRCPGRGLAFKLADQRERGRRIGRARELLDHRRLEQGGDPAQQLQVEGEGLPLVGREEEEDGADGQIGMLGVGDRALEQ